MSFPRAKIQRFNDVTNSVPSPTKYDPKLGEKVLGGCILKGESKGSVVSDCASTSSGKSCSTPIFRTPHVPKKHNCLGVTEKGNQFAFKSISFKPDDADLLNNDEELEELKALRVECSNKTETINDLEKHIQDLKNQLSNHEKSKAKLEAYISELETAKSNLECIKSNNENYEQQINTYQSEVNDLEKRVDELTKMNDELHAQLDVKKNKLEEFSLDYERKLISLEGTIEQLQMEQRNKEQIIEEMKKKEETYQMNHKVSIECLQGKISTLENEMKELYLNKSKNEAILFGLETQASNLNCIIESLKAEKDEIEIASKELKSCLKETEENCKIHSDTIMGLEMTLENRIKEIHQLKEDNLALKSKVDEVKAVMDEEKLSFEKKLNELMENQKNKLLELEKRFNDQKSLLENERKDFELEKETLSNKHAEEVLQMQNDYELKLLDQMQEHTRKTDFLQCQLDEKDALLERANSKQRELLEEWENKLREAENNFSLSINRMESEHLRSMGDVEKNFSKKINSMELNTSKVIDMKNKEIDLLSKQYREILEEIKSLLNYLEKKDRDIQNLSASNKNLNSRVKLMLEEIKLLNKEFETKSESLTKMTAKYNEEFGKNEQLSCKLGELDSKIFYLKEDLYKKIEEWKKSSEELKRLKHSYDRLMNQKCDLVRMVDELQEKIRQMIKEFDEKKVYYEINIKKLNDELMDSKKQCRKFEIVAGNTSKSLEALRKRLMESEVDVEKLNSENLVLAKKIEKSHCEKEDYRAKYESMLETKVDLEGTLDEYQSNNKILSEKCNQLESLCNGFEKRIEELKNANENLEMEKQSHVEAMKNLVTKQELQLIETEKATLDHLEQFNENLTEKLEFFVKFSAEKVKKFTSEISSLKLANKKVREELKSKSEEYDNLFTDCEIMKTTVEISVKENESLKKKYEDQTVNLEKLKDNLEKVTSEKETMEKVMAEKEEENSNLIEERETVKKELDEKEKMLEKTLELNEGMKTQLSDLESQVKQHEENIRIKSDQIEVLEKKIQGLETEIKDKESKVASCLKEKTICMEEIENLYQEKNDLMFNLKIAERKLETSENLVKEFREFKIQTEEDYKKKKIECEAIMSLKCSTESELLHVKEENDKLKLKLEAFGSVQERKSFYKENCLKLDNLCAELKDENASLKNDFDEIHSVLQDKEKKIEELVKRCSDLESLIGPFREQLERYETERMLIENDRELLRRQHLEQAAELGHRNHKQKIQHVVNLKNTLLETRKENEKYILQIKNLKKKVQKLQEQVGQDPKRLFIGGKRPETTPFKGKENSGMKTPSAVAMTPMTVKQEPMSPGSPLRNRNH